MILFTMTVQTNGDFTYNGGVPVCTGGVYVGPSNWGSLLAQCKAAPSTVNRIEMCIGGWGDPSWNNLKNQIAANGTNTTTALYRNLVALKNALGIDAIDSDDESAYDAASAIQFGRMCASAGLKLTLCPYTNPGYWQAVRSGLGANCDRVYLQCYDGGAGNNPASWNSYFSGLKVIAGDWDWNRDASFFTNMITWSAAGGPGGFLWPSCSGCNPPAGPSEMSQYANWILTAYYKFQPEITPARGFSGVAAYQQRTLPMSTTFGITNADTRSITWSLLNTSSWLTVSSSAGTLAAGAGTTVTVSLNPTTATNLPLGFYTNDIVFTNLTAGGSVAREFTLNTAVVNWPVAVTGFNAAILAGHNATAGNPGATGFDVKNNYCFYEQGLSGGTRGLPVNGIFSSRNDLAIAFQLGPYGAPDALMLGYNYAGAGTLTLAAPQAFNTLTLLAASANGGGQGTLVLNFQDGSHSPALAFNAQDWFYTVTNVAIQGFGRLHLGTTLNPEDNGDSNPNLYQTTINLASLGLARTIESITFNNPAGAAANQNTAIFAVSGMPASVPLPAPTGVAAIPGTNGTVRLSWNASAGATNYNVKQSVAAGGSYVTVGGGPDSRFVATGLANGTRYYFVVSAAGVAGESPNSAEVNAMPGSYRGWVFGADPVAYWPLDEANGTAARELVNGNNGTYSGGYAFYTGGVVGAGFASPHRAVIYFGANGSTQIPRLIGETNFSIVFWVKTGTAGGTPQWYNGKGLVDGEVGGTTNDFGVALVGGKVGFGVGNPDTTLTSVKSINDNNWHQIAVTRDAGNGAMRLYIDGVLDNSLTGPTGARATPSSLRIASLQTGANFLSGSISDVAMFSQVLTASQVGTLYSAATGLFFNVTLTNQWNGSNLILNWPGNGKLLEATNLAGPWTTNVSKSPVTITPSQPQKFYKVQSQ
jgi:hypothetical protein